MVCYNKCNTVCRVHMYKRRLEKILAKKDIKKIKINFFGPVGANALESLKERDDFLCLPPRRKRNWKLTL